MNGLLKIDERPGSATHSRGDLASSIWPHRVREKCIKDKSLAIAHGLEDVYVEPPASAKEGKGRKKKVEVEIDEEGEE